MLIDKLTLIGAAVAGVIGFGSGVYITSNHYEAKIAKHLKETADEISKIQKSNQVNLAKVISDRDDANRRWADVDDRNRDLTARLHELSSRVERPIVRTVISYKDEYERCSRFLQKSSRVIRDQHDLLERGCRLYGRCAADKDAIGELLKTLED